jgi:hypothetical protein
VVVPLLYLVHPSDPDRANNVPYADERIAAHWVVVVAVVLLGIALVRTLAGARAEGGRRLQRTVRLPGSRGRERLHAPGDPSAYGVRD